MKAYLLFQEGQIHGSEWEKIPVCVVLADSLRKAAHAIGGEYRRYKDDEDEETWVSVVKLPLSDFTPVSKEFLTGPHEFRRGPISIITTDMQKIAEKTINLSISELPLIRPVKS